MSILSNTKLAIFDWAGTIVDKGSRAPIMAFQKTFRENYSKYGIRKSEYEINQYMGLDKWTHLNNLTGNTEISNDLYPKLVKNMKHSIFECSEPIEEINSVFYYLLNRGYYVGSTSGYSRELLNIAIEKARYKSMYIPFNVSSDEVSKGRPYTDMINRNYEYFGIQKTSKSVKIGDTVADILEGVHGMCGTIIGITSDPELSLKMKENGATHVVDDVRKIMTIL